MVGAVFALVGCVLLVYLPPRGQAAWLALAFPVAFFGLGTLLYLAVAWSIRSRKPFRHAASDVLPDVPREPVPVPPEAKFDGRMPYEWLPADDPTDRGGLLRPIPNYLRLGNWAIILWITFIALFASTLPWIVNDPKDFSAKVGLSSLITLLGLFCGGVGAGLFIWLRKVPFQMLVPVRVDWKEHVCQLGTRPDDKLPLSQIVAVQLCAACRRTAGGVDKMFQLNLVWENPDRADVSEPCYHRRNLLSTTTPQGLEPVAEQLAEALGVPLLHHATREHWQREREASRDRAW